MAELIFLAACTGAVFTLAMRRAPLWAWALAGAIAIVLWQ